MTSGVPNFHACNQWKNTDNPCYKVRFIQSVFDLLRELYRSKQYKGRTAAMFSEATP